ncbi:MAG: hypothetical protein R6W96_02270 [Clostridia bacterium]
MKKSIILLTLAIVLFAFVGCDTGAKEKNETGIYQYTSFEEGTEYVEIMVNGNNMKFLTRVGETEYAAIPDFLQKGDEISFSYKYDKALNDNILLKISAPVSN